MAYNPFENAVAIRDQVTEEQQKQITALYKRWAKELDSRATYLEMYSTSWSSGVQRTQYDMLKRQMQQISHQVSNDVYTVAKDGMFKVADAVIKDSVDWMSSFGFSVKGLDAAFEHVPASVVNSLITGSVYGNAGSWNLSKAIWSDNEKALRDIYQIMAGGLAKNDSVEEIARRLKSYIDPNIAFDWQGPTGMKIYKHKVDYNAQRLVRTLTQHTYQQSMVAAAKDNPFIEEFIWEATGPRVCPICADRDGQVYKKDKLPLDHPNGMCTVDPVIPDDIVDKLADWVNSEDGTYPEIDEFAHTFGYDAGRLSSLGLQGIREKYGNSKHKTLNTWFQRLPKDVQAEVKALKKQSGLKWDEWYKQNIYLGGSNAKPAKQEATVVKKVVKKQVNVAKAESSADKSFDAFKTALKDAKKQKRCGLTDEVIDELANALKSSNSRGLCDAYSEVLQNTKGFRFIRDEDKAYYMHKKGKAVRKLSINMQKELKEASKYGITDYSKFHTMFHEMGHAIDDNLTKYFKEKGLLRGAGKITETKQLRDALKEDLKVIGSRKLSTVIRAGEPGGLSAAIFRDDAFRVRGASDFLSGVYHLRDVLPEVDKNIVESSSYNLYISYGHSKEYYMRRVSDDMYGDLASELFANTCSAIATGNEIETKALKLISPNFFDAVSALFA